MANIILTLTDTELNIVIRCVEADRNRYWHRTAQQKHPIELLLNTLRNAKEEVSK